MADIKDLKAQKLELLKTLLPGNAARIGRIMAEMDAALDGVSIEDRKAMLKRAAADPKGYGRQLAEARVKRIFNNIEAQAMASVFFEIEELGEGDSAFYVVRTRDKAYITYIGENGKPSKRQKLHPETPTYVPMDWISSEEVEYPIASLITGNLRYFDEVNTDIQMEIALQKDVWCKTLLDANVNATFPAGTLSPHRLVVTDNLPTGNYLDLQAQGSLNLTVFKQILDYAAKAGLVVRTIQIPSAHKSQIWDFVSLVAGFTGSGFVEDPKLTVPQEVQLELFRTGKLTNIMGQEVDIVGRNTLALKYLWVSFDKPAGIMYRKPSLDKVIHDTSADKQKENKESLMAKENIGLAMPSPMVPHVLKVRYAA
jgi:hypothetical protein